MYDLVVKNGLVITQKGSEVCDVGINGSKIIKIASHLKGLKEIDATGLVVSPGFIDMHTHSDVSFTKDSRNASKLSQGVTTEMVGCCGYSYYPNTPYSYEQLVLNREMSSYDSDSILDFIKKFRQPMSIHWASMVGHGPLRRSVVGEGNDIATDQQITEMKTMLDKELSCGAFGLSLGLAYAPGMFADIHELIELGKVVKAHNKMITAHIRNENIYVFDAVNELIEVGKVSGAHVHISHLKLGYGSWHQTEKLLKLIDDANKKGIRVTFEQYPYEASSTGVAAILPNWVHEGGRKKMLETMKTRREEVIAGIEESNSYAMGLDRVIVVSTEGLLPEGDGRSIRDISQMLELTEAETVLYLLEKSDHDLSTVRFTMDEEDVYTMLQRKDSAIISDATARNFECDVMPHPRGFGSFTRFLRLNREHQWMSLEEAIYKMTGLPAKLLQIKDRGEIAVGKVADLVVFDENAVTDLATYDQPIQMSQGINHVIVAGKLAFSEGKVTDERAGEFLLSF